ncbi:DUF262 domain-containing protein [Hansschlegelia plantiphila]|uniref:DUF262 domain-containing protein n=1 Tax=Hansschlegelia plantiphila TaxID=374655 RepID=A0A9W6IZ78_9HYPH|nr:DUF262 domain-containing protein [Hansschlegelia plantiphila]GLK67876.1 hypothetical protein GCM10008179_15140 [Hansschlegelia plantiphila]
MKVTPVSKTLADVLRGSFLKVPRFQRPYDWDRENLTEFWNDLKDRSDPDYFMGSVVIFADQKEKNVLFIVDGQQRITTITIMLSIIRDALADLDEAGPSEAVHKLIEARDLDDKRRFVLEHDPADRYLQYAIQSQKPDHKAAPEGPQQLNLQAAYRFLQSGLNLHLKNTFSNKRKESVDYLKHIRDCLLQMHFISIELDNEDDAYVIFETLNTRGKDLRVSDLLKNHFMRLIPQKTKGLDTARDNWSEMMETLNSVTVMIDPDSFILHYWLSSQSYVSKANLFLKFKEKIKKNNAKNWLDEVNAAARTYVRCMAPLEFKFAKEERPLQESLSAIKVFGVAQVAPLMLAIMTQYERKVISLKSTRGAFDLIEKFTFQFNALMQSRGGGGVSNMYAKLAQSTMACDSGQSFANVLADMKDKFRERVPDETEFSLQFTRITYRDTYTRERPLVRYVLTKLARHYGMPAEIDVGMLTIEHIQPQSNGEETNDEFDVGAIGNLIFMNEGLNGKLDNKSFVAKKPFFEVSNNVYPDDFLKKSNKWSDKMIAERGVHLAGVGYNEIWNI